MPQPRPDPNLERLAAISQLYGALVEPQQRHEEQKQRQMMEMLSLALQAHAHQQTQRGEDKFHSDEANWHHSQIDAQQQEKMAALQEREDFSKARLEAGQHGHQQEFLEADPAKQHMMATAYPKDYAEAYHNLGEADIPALHAAVQQLYANPDMKDSSRQAGLSGVVAQHPGASDLIDWTDESLYGKKAGSPTPAPQEAPPSRANAIGQKGHEMFQHMGTGLFDGAAATANYTAVPIWNALRGLFGKSSVSPIQYK